MDRLVISLLYKMLIINYQRPHLVLHNNSTPATTHSHIVDCRTRREISHSWFVLFVEIRKILSRELKLNVAACQTGAGAV